MSLRSLAEYGDARDHCDHHGHHDRHDRHCHDRKLHLLPANRRRRRSCRFAVLLLVALIAFFWLVTDHGSSRRDSDTMDDEADKIDDAGFASLPADWTPHHHASGRKVLEYSDYLQRKREAALNAAPSPGPYYGSTSAAESASAGTRITYHDADDDAFQDNDDEAMDEDADEEQEASELDAGGTLAISPGHHKRRRYYYDPDALSWQKNLFARIELLDQIRATDPDLRPTLEEPVKMDCMSVRPDHPRFYPKLRNIVATATKQSPGNVELALDALLWDEQRQAEEDERRRILELEEYYKEQQRIFDEQQLRELIEQQKRDAEEQMRQSKLAADNDEQQQQQQLADDGIQQQQQQQPMQMGDPENDSGAGSLDVNVDEQPDQPA
ncbi:hypothetical protein BC831DRAFT_505153 [Entophlyctis helioformis]|nr:hypothetical protein BC831DRAFT_505153 [Entophlyctis helioformis]